VKPYSFSKGIANNKISGSGDVRSSPPRLLNNRIELDSTRNKMSKRFTPMIITLPAAKEPRTRSGAPIRPTEEYLEELKRMTDRKEEHVEQLKEMGASLDDLRHSLHATLDDSLTSSVIQLASLQHQPPQLYPEHVNQSELLRLLLSSPAHYEVQMISKLKPKLYRRRQFEIVAQIRALEETRVFPEAVKFEVQVYSTVHPIKRLELNSKETPLLLYSEAESSQQGRVELKRLTFTEDTCAFPYEKVHLALVCCERNDVRPLILEDLHVSTPRKKY